MVQVNIADVHALYDEVKFWIALAGVMWPIFKAIEWLKAIKTNDLHHIQTGVESLRGDMKDQTEAIVYELRELRGDMRTVTTGLIAK